MQDVIEITWAVLFGLTALACWGLNVFSLPGNWITAGVAILYAALMPVGSRVSLDWKTVGVLIVLAALGELIEFLASAAGASKAGGSKRGAVLSLIGGLTGAIVGLFVGIPIPVIGPIVTAILFTAAGALLGAMAGESWKGRSLDHSWTVGKAAFWGRILGTLGKIIFGSIMVGVIWSALVVK